MAPRLGKKTPAIAHAHYLKISTRKINMHYIKPAINLNHLKELTTSFAMIQFSIINKPDLKKSGHTMIRTCFSGNVSAF
jgi:hypothetical protein